VATRIFDWDNLSVYLSSFGLATYVVNSRYGPDLNKFSCRSANTIRRSPQRSHLADYYRKFSFLLQLLLVWHKTSAADLSRSISSGFIGAHTHSLRVLSFTHPVRSVFESSGPAVTLYKWLGANLWKFPTGVYFCFFGLILLATFTVRIYLGSSSLPVLLKKEPHSSGETEGRWNRYKWLIFTLVGPIFLLAGIAVLLGILPHLFGIHPLSSILATVLAAFTKTVDGLTLIVVALLILGKSERKTAWKCVQLPEARFVLCALLLLLAISLLVSAAPYFMDRAQWAANDFGKTSPPLFGTYFEVGRLRDPWLAFLLLGAFGEEIVFRGLLLRQFMRRYGVHRAVFFTGIVWAAVHFRSDSYVGLSVAWVLYHLAWRILACLAWNYVFCWMTLRWRSVIPAAAAHTALNILIISGINRNVAWSAEYGLILGGIAGVVLFRYWPLKNEENGIVEIATA